MWPARRPETVSCPACGATIDRERAREYDKHGDRWDREGKEFEHLCRSCYDDLCQYPRDELEDLLVEIGAGERSRDAFLAAYVRSVEERYGPFEEQ
ncbi:hypothetical protein ACFQGT_19410 [Natrialbaceae archaeon GCM10025810]|uniref:DUF7562 family protein n=1 Tax=Halovalidus salilacus TaxID=3075124 RepID=UPI00361F8399